MKRLFIVGCLALAAVGTYFFLPPLQGGGPHPRVQSALPAPPGPSREVLRTNTDAVEVFRRAFWREPGPGDEILHAERREWVDPEHDVRSWQWFIAVKPSAAFTTWLKESNPFRMAAADPAGFQLNSTFPAWFPKAAQIAKCAFEQTPDRRMTLIFDSTEGVLYATDAGQGFAIGSAAPPAQVAKAQGQTEGEWQPRR